MKIEIAPQKCFASKIAKIPLGVYFFLIISTFTKVFPITYPINQYSWIGFTNDKYMCCVEKEHFSLRHRNLFQVLHIKENCRGKVLNYRC